MKHYVTILFLLVSVAANAQLSAGSQYIGGGFSLYAPLTRADTTTSFGADVEYFRLTRANLAFGVRAGYADNRARLGENLQGTFGQGQYFLAPNVQRFFSIVGRFGVLAGLEAVLSYQQTRSFDNNQEVATGTSLGLAGNLFTGAYFQPSDRLLLRLNIGRAGLINVSNLSQRVNQADVRVSSLSYSITPTYSIAGSSLSLFYRF